MFKRGVASIVVMAMASVANAGALVELQLGQGMAGFQEAPTNLDGSWNGGEKVLVEFWFTADNSFSIRSAQIDHRNSSPELMLGQDIDTVNQLPDGIPNFWFDYSRSVLNQGTYPAMGVNIDDESTTADYVDFSNLLAGDPIGPFPPSMVTNRSTHSATRLIEVTNGVLTRLGGMPVMLPTTPGTYFLDLVSADPANRNNGASIGFGFGGAATGDHPVTLWSSATGDPEVNDSVAYATGQGPMQFVVVPEPATLVMLTLGGIAAAMRRRRSA